MKYVGEKFPLLLFLFYNWLQYFFFIVWLLNHVKFVVQNVFSAKENVKIGLPILLNIHFRARTIYQGNYLFYPDHRPEPKFVINCKEVGKCIIKVGVRVTTLKRLGFGLTDRTRNMWS